MADGYMLFPQDRLTLLVRARTISLFLSLFSYAGVILHGTSSDLLLLDYCFVELMTPPDGVFFFGPPDYVFSGRLEAIFFSSNTMLSFLWMRPLFDSISFT